MARKQISFKEAILNNAYMLQAIIDILESQGVLTKQQVLDVMKKVKKKMNEGMEGYEVSEN